MDKELSAPDYEWDAFLSYSSQDVAIARRVQRFLERYPLPDGRRLRIYRDETDIAGGELPEQLREAMAKSGCLVVCCSNAAVVSDWVSREIEAFRELAPERPILPVLIADTPPKNLPPPLRTAELRWADLRKGWRIGLPRQETRVELVRVVATAAGMDFRTLLPLDRRRRRRTVVSVTAAIVSALIISAWFPVESWVDVTPEGMPVFGCDTLDDGIAFYRLNEPQAIKSIVDVRRDVFGPNPRSERLGPDLIPHGRLLPSRVGGMLRKNCGGGGSAWIGQPEPGTCIKVSRSEQIGAFYDHMGGTEAPLTDVSVGGRAVVLDRMWDLNSKEFLMNYGRTITPSNGLPVAAKESDLWIGFPDGDTIQGKLWHSSDKGRTWKAEQNITDVRSVRHLSFGVMVAGRLDRKLGFFLRREDKFEPFDVPGKGDQIEICGEVDGRPVVRTDRRVYHLLRLAWWRSRLN